MKELEKQRAKRNKKRAREEEAGKLAALALNAGLAHGLGVPPGLSKAVEKNIENFSSQQQNTNQPNLVPHNQPTQKKVNSAVASSGGDVGNSININAPNPQRDFYPVPNAGAMQHANDTAGASMG